jgi:CheY-like chemotaxis protein
MTSSTLTPIPEAESDWARPTAAVRQILIVDDSDYDVSLIRTILEPAGFSVIDFQSGRLGLQAINERAFDLVILDLRMPDVDGFDILEAIRYQTPKPQSFGCARRYATGIVSCGESPGCFSSLG